MRETERETETDRQTDRERQSLSLHSHHMNDACVKMGSDESDFEVLLIIIIVTEGQSPVSAWQ